MTDKPTSLKDYWYPKEHGEQHPIVTQLKQNVTRPSLSTKIIETLPTLLLSLALVIILILIKSNFIRCCIIGTLITISLLQYLSKLFNKVYILDFSICELPEEFEVPRVHALGTLEKSLDEDSVSFVDRITQRSGLGDHCYFPKVNKMENPPKRNTNLSREETYTVMYDCCDKVFEKTGISPKDIDCVITNCSIFCPTPSMSAMVMNHYKMRQNCENYSLGGMGCSAGLIAVNCAKNFLQTHRNSTVLIFSTENITSTNYFGKDKSRLLTYTLFRTGGAAIILTNKLSLRSKCKYEMTHLVRMNRSLDDEAFNVIHHSEDNEGELGVFLGRNLVDEVSKTIAQNLDILLPQVLPLKEKLKMYKNTT